MPPITNPDDDLGLLSSWDDDDDTLMSATTSAKSSSSSASFVVLEEDNNYNGINNNNNVVNSPLYEDSFSSQQPQILQQEKQEDIAFWKGKCSILKELLLEKETTLSLHNMSELSDMKKANKIVVEETETLKKLLQDNVTDEKEDLETKLEEAKEECHQIDTDVSSESTTSSAEACRFELEKELDKSKKENSRLQQQLSEAVQKVRVAEEEKKERHIQEKDDEFANASTELVQLKSDFADVQRERDEYKQDVERKEGAAKFNGERIKKLEEAIERSLDQQDRLMKQLDQSEDDCEKLLMETQNLESKLKDATTSKGGGGVDGIDAIRDELMKAKKLIFDKNRKLEELKLQTKTKLIQSNEECEQFKKSFKDATNERDILKKELDKSNNECAELRRKLFDTQQSQDVLASEKMKLEIELSECKANLTRCKGENVTLWKSYDDSTIKQNRLKNDLEKTKAEHEKLKRTTEEANMSNVETHCGDKKSNATDTKLPKKKNENTATNCFAESAHRENPTAEACPSFAWASSGSNVSMHRGSIDIFNGEMTKGIKYVWQLRVHHAYGGTMRLGIVSSDSDVMKIGSLAPLGDAVGTWAYGDWGDTWMDGIWIGDENIGYRGASIVTFILDLTSPSNGGTLSAMVDDNPSVQHLFSNVMATSDTFYPAVYLYSGSSKVEFLGSKSIFKEL